MSNPQTKFKKAIRNQRTIQLRRFPHFTGNGLPRRLKYWLGVAERLSGKAQGV